MIPRLTAATTTAGAAQRVELRTISDALRHPIVAAGTVASERVFINGRSKTKTSI